MTAMQTRNESFGPSLDWLTPFGSWEAAARWNAMAFEWMTSGWKQWLDLSTAWPALEHAATATAGAAAAATNPVVPAQAGTQEARNARSVGAVPSSTRAKDDKARASNGTRRSGDTKPRARSAKATAARTERASASAGGKRPAAKRSGSAPATARSRSRTRG
jgi:hypothetical protein